MGGAEANMTDKRDHPRLEVVLHRDENRVRVACQSTERRRTQILDWADHVWISQEQRRKEHAKDDGHDPATNKSLNSFLGRQLDKRSLAPEEAENVRPDIVGNDERDGQEEPDQTLKDIVDNEVTLADNQQERHMGPCKL